MKTIFTCLFVSVVLFVSAQQNTFKMRAFAPDYSYLNKTVQLNDGSFISTGGIYQDVNGNNNNLYLLKTDNKGNVLASKAVTTYNSSVGYFLTKTADGNFAICGASDEGMLLMKFKANLTPLWAKQYTVANGGIAARSLVQAADGGFMLICNSAIYNSDTSGNSNCVFKTDSAGNPVFLKRYANYGVKEAYDITATTDGNYAFLALTNDGNGNDTAIITKIKPDGNVLWSRYFYDNALSVYPAALNATSDGGIVITGDAFDYNTIPVIDQSVIAKYNNAGTLLWSKTTVTTGNSENYPISIIEDADGGYLFAGELDTYDDPAHKVYDTVYGYIVKTSASGALQWTKTFEPSFDGYTGFYSLLKTTDGGYAASGEGYFFNADDEDYNDGSFLYKFNSSFEACNELPGSNGTIQNFGNSVIADTTTSNIGISVSTATITLADAGTVDNVCSSALPLQLLSFNASLQNKSVAVQWTTANEINTSYFTVERSKDAASFSALQQVAAKGNSAGVQTYNTTDLQPLAGTSYYRLQEVDKDGKITYSSVVPVTMLNNGVIIISPNPVRDVIRVVIQSTANANITCQLIDMKGAVLATQKTSVASGRNEILIPAASLAKGVYILKVIENNTTQTLRFIKE